MTRPLSIILYVLCLFSLAACREDKGNESMPYKAAKDANIPTLNFLNEAIEDSPEDDELLSKRASLYFSMYRFQEALADIKTAVKINQGNAEYFILLAQINFSLEKHFEAIKASEKAESLGSTNPELSILQARVYWETGDTTRSMLYLRKAEQIIPNHSGINLLKAKSAASKADTTTAISYYLFSIRNDRKNLDAYRDLIKIYLNKAKDDSALYFIIRAKEINPNQTDLFYAEGRIYQRKELKQSAMLSYNNCLREDSSFAPALYQLGQIYFREANPGLALNYYKKYITLNNDSKEVYQNLITILNGQNNQQATIPYYERLVQLDSTNTGLKYTLQKLYKQYAVAAPSSNVPSYLSPDVIIADTTRRRRVRAITDSTRVNSVGVDTIK